MSRDPLVSTHHAADSALSDDDLDGVVGGYDRGDIYCSHGLKIPHLFMSQTGTVTNCPGPTVASSDP